MSANEVAPDKAIPANIEAEEAVLGSLMIDPDATIKVGSSLRGDDFYVARHQWIYQAMADLHERREPVDFVTVCDELERQERLSEVGGRAFIAGLINAVPSAIYVEHYANIVERQAVLRRLISAAGQIAALAYDESHDAREVVDQAEHIIYSIAERQIERDLRPIKQVMHEMMDRLEYLHRHQGEFLGIPTGFTLLDKLLGGLQKSDLVIVAARPGVGKTSLALNIAHNAAKKFGRHVAIFSLEMSAEQLGQRLLSLEAGVDSQHLRLGNVAEDEWPILTEAAGILASTGIYIDDTPALSPMEIRTKARRLHAEHGLDLIIVDYMQLMQGEKRTENRVQEISYISRSLKALARELNLPLLALSQLSRAVESRQDKIPILSDLRESGSIEQDADVVMFVYREDMYIEDSERKNIAEIIIAKHRNGPVGKIDLYFRKELTQFLEVEWTRHELEPA